MGTSREGVRRLAHFVGGASAFVALVWLLRESDMLDTLPWPRGWVFAFLLECGSYTVGWAVVRGVAWVRDGFAQDRRP